MRSEARPWTTSSPSRTGISGPGPSSCDGTTGRSRRSSTPPTGSSGSTTRTVSRSGPASSSGCAPQRVRPPPAPVRLEAFASGRRGGGLDRRRDRPADRGRRRAARPRGPRPGERPCRPDPARPQHGRRPVAVLGGVRTVCPARGAAAAGVPAGHRRPRIERRPVRPRRIGRLRPRRRGPDRDRQHGPSPQPVASGRSSRSSTASRASCASRPATRATVHRLVVDLRGYASVAHERPAGEVLYAFLRDSGMLARLVGDRHAARPRRRSRTSPGSSRSSGPSRRCSPTTARSSSPATSPTLIEAGDDPATAELDPDVDAVAVLTVHKAKGLEFPVVFLPGMVAGRFPANGRGEPLALPAGLGRGDAADAEASPSPRNGGCATWR